MDATDLQRKIDEVGFWWHSISLAPGYVTPGHKTPAQLDYELKAMRLPDLSGKTVIDVGAWDGFFSFESERRGASRVVALDHYVWSLDIPAARRYWDTCRENGRVPQQYHSLPDLWRPHELPGKRGFDVARAALGSRVEARVDDLMQGDPERFGQFDVALYLGVLYHLQNPFEGLQRLARLVRELAIIETEAIVVPGYEDVALCEFYESNELNADVSNWWGPTEKAVLGMCRAAGFRRAESLVPPPVAASPPPPPTSFFGGWRRRPPPRPPSGPPLHYRAFIHAWK